MRPLNSHGAAGLLLAFGLAIAFPQYVMAQAGQSQITAGDTVEIDYYNDKGLAGHQQVTWMRSNQVSSSFKLAWNNRRWELEEQYTLDKNGYPVKIQISGTAPFGDSIEEQFEWNDGNASWQSRAQDDQIRLPQNQFYVPVDTFVMTVLINALLQDSDGTIDTLPSGSVHLEKLHTTSVNHKGTTASVSLYALTGLDLTPTFIWLDGKNHFFAWNISGWMKGIRSGWGLETFEQLDNITQKAELEYYQSLSARLTNTLNQPLVLAHARVLDVENRRVLDDHDVLVEDGKIVQIGQGIQVGEGAQVIDVKGKTLIPGLWDMHAHLSKDQGFSYLAAGVTSVRDIGNSPDNMAQIETLFGHQILGPRIYKAGFIDKQSDYSAGTGITVETLDEAKEAVDWYADNGYLQIKTYSSMDPAWMKELAGHVHARGLRLSGHIPAFMTADQAVDAGFDEIQHINMLFLNFLADDKVDTRKRLRFSLIGDRAHELDLQSPSVQAFVEKLAQNGIEVDLTVSTFRTLLLTRNKAIDPEYADIADHLPANLVRQFMKATMNVEDDAMDSNYRQSAEALMAMTKLLFDKGVPILPGTDYFSGFTLIRELELYAMAGIPPMEVLRIGTLNSASVVGAAQSSGSIAEGKVADLVLIDGNPLENMADLRKATLVIQGDKLYYPSQLHQSIGVKPFVD
ncbi:amidohydrolase family protein [Alteromonas aestuariivivens]|nr:amidohydrolase family protein [Alteromonas aestuariivivens]